VNGAANAAFGAIVIVGEGLHGVVLAVVFQGDEEFIADKFFVRPFQFLLNAGHVSSLT